MEFLFECIYFVSGSKVMVLVILRKNERDGIVSLGKVEKIEVCNILNGKKVEWRNKDFLVLFLCYIYTSECGGRRDKLKR